MRELTLEARVKNLQQVLSFLEGILEENGCPLKKKMQIDIAVEEIFVNVARYAYSPGTGVVQICVEPLEAGVEIIVRDQGMPYDPLKAKAPDITLPSDKRPIGGLGVFMMKKIMDEARYEYREGWNVLTMRVSWQKSRGNG